MTAETSQGGDVMISSEAADDLVARIRSSRLTYCGPPKLENLVTAIREVRLNDVVGDFIEAGVALGGSAILLGRLKPPQARIWLYDVYGTIPPPDENDGPDAHARFDVIRSGRSEGLGGDGYYGYVDDLLERVKSNLREFGVDPDGSDLQFVRGLFEETLRPSAPIALAHIDCDWYASVRTCIDRILPLLSPGGIIVFDDYNSYSGCRRAVDEMLIDQPHLEVLFEARSLAVRRP
jgi:hypothetical protein